MNPLEFQNKIVNKVDEFKLTNIKLVLAALKEIKDEKALECLDKIIQFNTASFSIHEVEWPDEDDVLFISELPEDELKRNLISSGWLNYRVNV